MNEETEPLYYAKDGCVWKRSLSRREGNSTSFTLGFKVLEMSNDVGPNASHIVANLMNAGDMYLRGVS